MWAAALTLALLAGGSAAPDRKISSILNPGCDDCNESNTTLVYARCDGAKDTVHQIWDFTRGKPTVIFAITDLNNTMKVRWEHGRPAEFKWASDPKYSFAVVLNNIWEYNDIKDLGPLDPRNETVVLDTAQLRWNRTEIALEQTETMLHVVADGYRSWDEHRNGTISLKFNLLPFTDSATELPHLIHSANSTLLDLSLVNLTTSQHFNSSRFAVEFLFVSMDKGDESITVKKRKGLDDEHTPGVFEIDEVTTPESTKHGDGGFMQYRPVAYTAEFREVTATTVLNTGRDLNRTTLPHRSTVRQFYKDTEIDKILVQNMLVSIGETGDGFYTKTNYTACTFTIGYGLPPVEGFSLYVILVISIGLSIPALLLLAGGVYMLMRRRSMYAPQRLQD